MGERSGFELILRHSFANPYWWGWHRFLWWEATRRGVML